MTVVLATPKPTQDEAANEYAEIVVHFQARVVTATRARRKVNGWLCLEVGDRMLAGEPELLLGDPTLWRVPVQWTWPTAGVLMSPVGHVLVDAVTGKLLVAPSQAEEMQQRVAATARTLRSTVE